jgi:hypothetical protein
MERVPCNEIMCSACRFIGDEIFTVFPKCGLVPKKYLAVQERKNQLKRRVEETARQKVIRREQQQIMQEK